MTLGFMSQGKPGTGGKGASDFQMLASFRLDMDEGASDDFLGFFAGNFMAADEDVGRANLGGEGTGHGLAGFGGLSLVGDKGGTIITDLAHDLESDLICRRGELGGAGGVGLLFGLGVRGFLLGLDTISFSLLGGLLFGRDCGLGFFGGATTNFGGFGGGGLSGLGSHIGLLFERVLFQLCC